MFLGNIGQARKDFFEEASLRCRKHARSNPAIERDQLRRLLRRWCESAVMVIPQSLAYQEIDRAVARHFQRTLER